MESLGGEVLAVSADISLQRDVERFVAIAIEVKDMEASILFYQTFLGFKIEQTLPFMGGEWFF